MSIESPFDEAAVRDARRAYVAARLSLVASEATEEEVEQAAWREGIAAGYTSLLQRRRPVVCHDCGGSLLQCLTDGEYLGLADPSEDAKQRCDRCRDCPGCAHTPHPGVVWEDALPDGVTDTSLVAKR